MFCNKCGNKLEDNQRFCNRCGNQIVNNPINVVNNPVPNYNVQPVNNVPSSNIPKKNNSNKTALIGFGIGLFIIALSIIVVKLQGKDDIIITENPNKPTPTPTVNRNNLNDGETAIVYDNHYVVSNIKNAADAKKLISKDSTQQKVNCPTGIVKIEDKMIKNFSIIAVNYCEMDEKYSANIESVVKKIYQDFPGVKGHLTNMSIINLPKGSDQKIIAEFYPFFIFAETEEGNTFPWIIKTQLLMNSQYFLNLNKLEKAMIGSSKSGHFPPNANIYSAVAHELGHYISYIAMLKSYGIDEALLYSEKNSALIDRAYNDFAKGNYSLSLLKEAHSNYEKDNGTIDFDDWRATISKYAVTKSNNGTYIYDETIAESFHDVFVNGNNARPASKYIYKVLQSKLKG